MRRGNSSGDEEGDNFFALPEWTALRKEDNGFLVFLEFIIRVAEEGLGTEDNRVKGKFCTQVSKREQEREKVSGIMGMESAAHTSDCNVLCGTVR